MAISKELITENNANWTQKDTQYNAKDNTMKGKDTQ